MARLPSVAEVLGIAPAPPAPLLTNNKRGPCARGWEAVAGRLTGRAAYAWLKCGFDSHPATTVDKPAPFKSGNRAGRTLFI